MSNLMGKKWFFFATSALLIVPGIVSLVKFGLNLGIDFTGGTVLEYHFQKDASQEQISKVLSEDKITYSTIAINDKNTYTIKSQPLDKDGIDKLQNDLTSKVAPLDVKSVETIGPVIGGETSKNALIALGLASVMIVAYIALSFHKIPKPASSWRFGITAVAALLHDVLLVIGVFSILGHFLKVEVDILFVTALLTVIGFSVHDTIVVFDRIRENLPKHLSKSFTEVANLSIVQTLARSLNTSLTVIFVLLALLLFGGESIRWFVVALLVGIISGTYSSIFNATALLVLWEEKLGH